MLKVRFRDYGEIRMGSPFRVAGVIFEGDGWKPPLEDQSIVFEVLDQSAPGLFALARWDAPIDGGPAFRALLVDTVAEKTFMSEIIQGAPESIAIIGPRKVSAQVFRHPHGVRALEIDVTNEYRPRR